MMPQRISPTDSDAPLTFHVTPPAGGYFGSKENVLITIGLLTEDLLQKFKFHKGHIKAFCELPSHPSSLGQKLI